MNNIELINYAKKAMNNAYAPYSNFCVGAALLTDDGTVYTGCNIENSSFGATICAERTAAVKAVSEGHRRFTKIAIVSKAGGYTYPCGICRQVIVEFAEDKDIKIFIVKSEDDYIETTLDEILPGSFTKKDLEK